MLFNSLQFAIFLPIVFAIYWLLPHKYRWVMLLISSYYFYMSWNPKYVVLILLTTAVSYGTAIFIENTDDERKKKGYLLGALLICLGVLFVFKYFNFVSESVVALCSCFALKLHPVTLKLVLPVGISFYTFQTLSYVIDVYRGQIKAEKNFGVYATFVSFFPQLVAGPIERSSNLLPQITSEKKFDYEKASYGLKQMAWGYYKKLCVADIIGVYVDRSYENLDVASGMDYFVAIFFFTIQIYCDFSGYSDIAIGTAKLLGVDLMTNFKSPYFSVSVKEFWSRWHISLSTWFKDYVYIPLGGNRCSKLKRDRNLMITFLVSGLWHGASWTFVFWGGIHGLMQVVENHLGFSKEKKNRLWRFVSWAFVFAFCNLAWVFFRAQDFASAVTVIKGFVTSLSTPASFLHNSVQLAKEDLIHIMFSILVLTGIDFAWTKTDVIEWISKRKLVIRWLCYLIFIWMILCFMPTEGSSQFVYFQF